MRRTLKSSNLPKSIKKEAHHLITSGNALHEKEGLNLPNPGPVLLILEMAIPTASLNSRPNS